MRFWPLKKFTVETALDQEEIHRLMDESTDQDNKSIYWGKRFYKPYWGKVSNTSFRIRPVVPYWNISPVEIRASLEPQDDQKTIVNVRMGCPFMRVVAPLVVLAVVLFFISFGLQGEPGVFLNSSGLILLGAYLMVNIPYQIQAGRNIRDLVEKLDGEINYTY